MEVEDRSYSIVDRNGNYYRLDDENQLVAVNDISDADEFTYSEALERIGSGRKTQFYNIVPFGSNIDGERPATMTASYDLAEMDWLEYLKHFLFVRNSMKDYEEELRQHLSDVDMEISDILHYVELYDITDGQSLDLMNQLSNCRDRRRQIKDRMLAVDWYQRAFGYNDINGKVKESIRQINMLERRTYKPRKLFDLYDGQKKVRKTKTRRLSEAAEIEYETETAVCYQEEGEVYMERERRETVYDGKRNDWLGFAKEQMIFFGNAQQYMMNLELDLERIDREIEEILVEIENVSCNVTQGYKVFKNLKDLRVERREKDKELRSLEAIAGCFDLDYMEASFRYSVGAITEIMTPVEKVKEDVAVMEVAREAENLAG